MSRRATFLVEELDLKSGHRWKLYCKSPIGICPKYISGAKPCLKMSNGKPCNFLLETCISAEGTPLINCKEEGI